MKTIKITLIALATICMLVSCKKDEDGQWIRYYKNKTRVGYVFYKWNNDSIVPIRNLKMQIESINLKCCLFLLKKYYLCFKFIKMKTIIPFLSQLVENNNKVWFDAHKADYKIAQQDFNHFVEKLIEGIAKFDNSVATLSIKDVTYRINRDLRFSLDKRPYKTHFGAYICPNGKCSGFGGYYFHIENNNCLLSTGIYMPDKNVLNSVREDIFAKGDEFEKSIKEAKNFQLDEGEKLKKGPKNFPSDSKFIEYLKLKNIDLLHFFPENMLSNPEKLLDYVLKEFETSSKFLKFLNRAINFHFEENH